MGEDLRQNIERVVDVVVIPGNLDANARAPQQATQLHASLIGWGLCRLCLATPS
ncbi:MAG: hypothetical protein AAFR44_12015 [Pseudomonadota bacterium]